MGRCSIVGVATHTVTRLADGARLAEGALADRLPRRQASRDVSFLQEQLVVTESVARPPVRETRPHRRATLARVVGHAHEGSGEIEAWGRDASRLLLEVNARRRVSEIARL